MASTEVLIRIFQAEVWKSSKFRCFLFGGLAPDGVHLLGS